MAGNGENESTHHFQSFIRGYSSQNNHSTMLGTMADMKTIPSQNISCTILIEGASEPYSITAGDSAMMKKTENVTEKKQLKKMHKSKFRTE